MELLLQAPSIVHWCLILAGYVYTLVRISDSRDAKKEARKAVLEAIRSETITHNQWLWLEQRHARLLEQAKKADEYKQDKSLIEEELAELHLEIIEASRKIPLDNSEFDAITDKFFDKLQERKLEQREELARTGGIRWAN